MTANGAVAAERTGAEVTPRCRHFGACGGCQLQHLSQSTQLQQKSAAVVALLQQAGVAASPMQRHAAQEYGYRNRIRLRVQQGELGYSMRSSNQFLAVSECPIATPLLWRAAATLQEQRVPWPAHSNEIELCTDSDEQGLQLLLHADATVATLDRDAPGQFRRMCEALQATVPQLRGGGLLVRGELAVASRRVQERQRIEVARWGAAHLRYAVDANTYTVSRGAFFQINRFLTGLMVQLVTGGRSGALAWDLFAGAGLFSLVLAEQFRTVVAVEVGQPAASDLAAALRGAGPQHRAIARPTLDFLRAHRTGELVPDVVVMDPPRAGLGSAITQQLARIGAPELVYVSCDATTFARDARALVDSRYAVTELHLLDLFPQTDHTETIAVFQRR